MRAKERRVIGVKEKEIGWITLCMENCMLWELNDKLIYN